MFRSKYNLQGFSIFDYIRLSFSYEVMNAASNVIFKSLCLSLKKTDEVDDVIDMFRNKYKLGERLIYSYYALGLHQYVERKLF